MNKKMIFYAMTVFVLGFAVASLFSSHSDYYNKYEGYKYGFIPYYSTIDKKCSGKDREIAEGIIALAGKIMTDTEPEITHEAGELKMYALKNADAERVEAKINLITASFTFSGGYVWVEYSQEVFDEKDNKLAEKEKLAYWKLKKIDGIWTVIKIKEVEV